MISSIDVQTGWKSGPGHRRRAGTGAGHGARAGRGRRGHRRRWTAVRAMQRGTAVTALGAPLPSRRLRPARGHRRPICSRWSPQVVTEMGRLDILVNNAGIIRRAPGARVQRGRLGRCAADQPESRFLSLAGRGARDGERRAAARSSTSPPCCPSRAASSCRRIPPPRAAVAGITRALANEWARHGINVNAIAPGYMATDNTAPLRADPERAPAILDRIPAGRWGAPDDLKGRGRVPGFGRLRLSARRDRPGRWRLVDPLSVFVVRLWKQYFNPDRRRYACGLIRSLPERGEAPWVLGQSCARSGYFIRIC